MIKFILVKEHEFKIVKVTNIGEILKIIFGEIKFDKVGTFVERRYF